MRKIRIIFIAITFLFLLIGRTVLAGEANGAKSIFYGEEGTKINSWSDTKTDKKPQKIASTKHKNKKYMGIEYWINLEGFEGRQSRVTANHVFHSGDRIKLALRTNSNGYLYVINFGSSGSSNVLFPRSNAPDNYVTAYTTYSVPSSSFMKFDATPGEETLLVLLSPQPITNLPVAPPDSKPTYAQYSSYTASSGAKDIIVEDDSTSEAPSQIAVAPTSTLDSGKVIPVSIKIRHE